MSIEQEIYNKLVDQFGIGEICIKKYRDRPQKTWLEFIEAALKLEASELYSFCGFSGENKLKTFSKYFNNNYKSLMLSKYYKTWEKWLLSIIEYSTCYKCGSTKSIKEFTLDSSRPNGLKSMCILCDKEYYFNNKDRIHKQKQQYRILNKEHIS